MKFLFGVMTSAIALISCAAIAAKQPNPLSFAFPRTDLEILREGTGEMARFIVTVRGRLDGLLLEDGLEARFPPQLSERLGAVLRRGRTVSISGYRSPAAPVVIAFSVTDVASNKTVAIAEEGPEVAEAPLPLTGPPVEGAQPTTISGKVKRAIYRPQGGVEGAVLQDDQILRLTPQTSNRAELLLSPGRNVTVQGWRAPTPFGFVIAAEQVTEAQRAEKQGPSSTRQTARMPRGKPGLNKNLSRSPRGRRPLWICRWASTGARSSFGE
jgi:hypothetical protein